MCPANCGETPATGIQIWNSAPGQNIGELVQDEFGWTTDKSAESDAGAEGIQTPVAHRGAAVEVLQHLLAGLRSGMSYCDAKDVPEMWTKARFVRQTESGIREAGEA